MYQVETAELCVSSSVHEILCENATAGNHENRRTGVGSWKPSGVSGKATGRLRTGRIPLMGLWQRAQKLTRGVMVMDIWLLDIISQHLDTPLETMPVLEDGNCKGDKLGENHGRKYAPTRGGERGADPQKWSAGCRMAAAGAGTAAGDGVRPLTRRRCQLHCPKRPRIRVTSQPCKKGWSRRVVCNRLHGCAGVGVVLPQSAYEWLLSPTTR